MAFKVLGVDDSRWAQLVDKGNTDIFYETSYCRLLTEETPHRPTMLVYEDDLGTVFDVTVAKAISCLPFFADIGDRVPHTPVDLASPDYNSPVILAEPSDYDELLRRYRRSVDQYCSDTGVVTEFVRFHPLSASVAACPSNLEIHQGAELVYIDLRAGYEAAFHGYRKGHKSTIKKATREGCGFRFCSNDDGDAVARISQLYIATMLRKDAKSVYLHGADHFQKMISHLGSRVVMMQALAGDEIASANMFLLGRKHVWFKYSGLEQQYRSSGAHTLMLDRAIHWACQQGFDYFMLGGGIKPGDSTHASKRGFSHLSAPIHHMKKIHNKQIFNLLIDAKRAYDSRLGQPTRTEYFPSYWLN